ncbi:MAG: hypothetical protein Q8M35_11890, partial [Pseudohongiella sp.]|nr:hypothetical protein [Pseudohongiella sp.]
MSARMTNSRQSIPAPMSAFQRHALMMAKQQSVAANHGQLLSSLREQGASEFERATWPGRKLEHWKYTSVQALQSNETAVWAAGSSASAECLATQLIPM